MAVSRTWRRAAAAGPAAALWLGWLFLSVHLLMPGYPHPNFSGAVESGVRLREPDRLRLAFTADVHDNFSGLQRFLKHAETRADAAVILGDIRQRGLAIENRLFISSVAHSPLPLFAIAGNHDLDLLDNGTDGFGRVFSTDRWWWRYGRNLFIALDDAEDGMLQAQEQWLADSLQSHFQPGDNLYVLLHRPPARGGKPDPDRLPARLVSLARAGANVHILAGHLHEARAYRSNGIPVTVCPNLGSLSGRPPAQLAYLILDCSRERCDLVTRDAGPNSRDHGAANFLLVDCYWGWLLAAALFLAAGLLWELRARSLPD